MLILIVDNTIIATIGCWSLNIVLSHWDLQIVDVAIVFDRFILT